MQILKLYTIIFCVDFMSEIGMKFNKEEKIKANEAKWKGLMNVTKVCIRN